MAVLAVVLSFAGSQALAANLWDNLLTYWNLDENAGGSAGDSGPGGSVNDLGTLRSQNASSLPAWIPGKFGSALAFNQTNQTNVLVPSSTDMNLGLTGSNAVTISTWVKLDKLPGDATAQVFGGIFDSSTDDYVMYVDRAAAELRFKVTAGPPNATTVAHPGIPATMLNTTDWHHVMGVYDGNAGSVKIYLNGGLVDVGSIAPLTNSLVRLNQVAAIGSEVATTAGNPASRFFDGHIDDMAIWNRALGVAEAQYLYNSGVGNAVGAANSFIAPAAPLTPVLTSAQPVIHYRFDGNLDNSGTGGAAYDAVFNDVPVNPAGPQYVSTKVGQGLDLSANGDLPTKTTPIATGNNRGQYVSVDYTLPDQGTIELRFSAPISYDFQTLWSNSVHGDAWEAWIYNNQRLSARLRNGSNAGDTDFWLPLEGGIEETHHIAYTWDRDDVDNTLVETRLYVNGVLREIQTGGLWLNPGATVFIGGGFSTAANNQNDLGSGIYDEFKIYDVVLSEAEILRNSMIPEPSSLALVALASLIAGACSTRRRVAQ